MKISVKQLSDYAVGADGTTIRLGVVDEQNRKIDLTLDVDQLGMLVVTLPSLIEKAMRVRFRDAALRYSYPADGYQIEEASDQNSLIMTLKTSDGFGVSFTISRQQADVLGDALAVGAITRTKVLAN